MDNTASSYTRDQLIRFAEAVAGGLRTAMVVVDRNLKVLAASPSFTRLLGTPADPRGQGLLALDGGRWVTAALRQALEEVLPHQRSFDDVEVSIPPPAGRRFLVSGRALHSNGAPAELIILEFDEAEANERTAEHVKDEQRLALEIVATVREPMLVLDYQHCVRHANHSFYRAFRVSRDEVEGRRLSELGNGQWDIPELRRQLETVLQKDRYFEDFQVEHEFEELGERIMLLNGRRIDHLRLILLAIEDVTERRRHERRQEMVISDLSHRVKNLLAVVQSVASQTEGASVDEFRSTFLGRLRALGQAQEALLANQWEKADLHDLISGLLAPHVEGDDRRIRLEGPSVSLPAERATIFGLIIHELATNAAKYGSLSAPSGQLSIGWDRAADQLRLKWQESGGPPVRQAPKRGFGTTFIERAVAYQLGGQVELSFRGEGLSGDLQIPLSQQMGPRGKAG